MRRSRLTGMVGLLSGLLACAGVQGTGHKAGFSNPAKSRLPLAVNFTLPRFVYQPASGIWQALSPSGLSGTLHFGTVYFGSDGSQAGGRGLEPFDPGQAAVQTQVEPDVRLVDAEVFAAGVLVAQAQGPIHLGSGNQLHLRPLLHHITVSTPVMPAKPGMTVRLEYQVWTPGAAPYRVLPDELMVKTIHITAGGAAIKTLVVNDEAVSLELAEDAKSGTQIGLQLELHNAEIATQTHPHEVTSTIATLTVGAP